MAARPNSAAVPSRTVCAPIPNSVVFEKARRYCNWGRWGREDELGAANHLTPARVVEAAGLVRTGRVFSLALPLDRFGPMTGDGPRFNPIHTMLADGGDIESGAQDHLPTLRFTDDVLVMALQSSTQWDALAHIFVENKMYNGYGTREVDSQGAHKNAITNVKDKMVGRGVLLDIARMRGREWLEPAETIHGEDLAACARLQGLEVREGDFVLVRTGHMSRRRTEGRWGDFAGGPAPGLGVSAADFLCPRGVAAVAADTWGIEVLPNETPDTWMPLHVIMLANAGMYFGEMWDLDELAADCAADGVYEFMVVAPPLTVTGGVGSPINPQAIK